MKIGVFGDIHGNIEALKAAYERVMTAHPDKIYHLGDLGGYAPFVNEVVEFLIEHGIEGVQGNYDEAVANDREHCGCRAEEPLQEEMAHLSFVWTKGRSSHLMSMAGRSVFFTLRRRKTISTGMKTGLKSSFMRWLKKSPPTS